MKHAIETLSREIRILRTQAKQYIAASTSDTDERRDNHLRSYACERRAKECETAIEILNKMKGTKQ